jgi:AcrR family transcriptional regulator
MPKVVSEYKDQARRRIIAAAGQAFHTRGFRSTTMEDIAREIGVSKGAIYLYFPSKIALLTALQEHSRDQTLQAWQRLLTKGDVAEGIVALLDDVFAGGIDPGIWLELLAESSQQPELRAALVVDHREDLRLMGEFLRQLETHHRIRRLTDRTVVAEMLLWLMHAAVVDLMVQGRAAETRQSLLRSLRFLLPSP